jgi:hypothetical protein
MSFFTSSGINALCQTDGCRCSAVSRGEHELENIPLRVREMEIGKGKLGEGSEFGAVEKR